MNDREQQDDAPLLLRCKRGDRDAFGALVRKYMKRAYFTALGFVGSHDDALDLSQEAFVRAYRSMERFEVSTRFFTWYYRILRNLCLNYLRDKSRRAVPFAALEERDEMRSESAEQESPLNIVAREDLREKVWEGLWNLETEEREIIVARDFLHVSYAELAELLGCPPGTVMSRLYYARKKLRDQLKDFLK
jgi:RNA polymerase sigma-70 factor (ECF subfamily)